MLALQSQVSCLLQQTASKSLQHGVQLVSQVIKHAADVIQNIPCCLHWIGAAKKHKKMCMLLGSDLKCLDYSVQNRF